jgi:hypothetical protein
MAKKPSVEDEAILENDENSEEIDEVVLAEDDDIPPEEPADEPESEHRGKNTPLTIALCVLNVLAAVGFAYLLVLDYQKRQEWSHAVFMNELFIEGLPLKEEDNGPSASRVTMPRQHLESKQISDVFTLRGGRGGGEFWAVDEDLPNRIAAKSLTPAILKQYFGSLGAPVATLEEEIKRLKGKVPADIGNVAGEVAEAFKGKNDVAKRQFATALLLPLANDVYQVEKLNTKLKAAKGAELDSLLDDAVQRRLLVDILAPCEIYRPGEVSKPLIEKVADLDAFKIDQLKALLQKRFDVAIADKFDGSVHQGPDWDGEKRLSWEKRQTIGFLLLAIANLHKSDPAKPGQFVLLYPEQGPAGTPNLMRAQMVLGLYEFAAAAQNLPLAWYALEERLVRSIQVDREGFYIAKEKDGKQVLPRNQAFIDKHADEISAIQEVMLEIKKAQERLKDLQEQNRSVKKIFEDRDEHLKAMTKRLVEARQQTARQVAELREKQKELFDAQAVLRDAEERNAGLERDIRAEEQKAAGNKGAKTP